MLKLSARKFLFSDFSVFVLFFIFWFCLFRFTESFTKGYNIYEDYSIIQIIDQLKTSSILENTFLYIRNNFIGRARFCPLGDFHRIASISVFGTNFTLYTFYIVLTGVFTSFFFYKFSRISGFSFLSTVFFGVYIFAGPYVIIWSDISNYESLGLLLLSLALFSAALSIYSGKNNAIYRYLFAVFLILSIFCKENFSLMIPAFLFLFVMMNCSKDKISMLQSMKNNFKFLQTLFAIMILYLLCIGFFIGINNQKYAGIDYENITLKIFPDFFMELIKHNITYPIILGFTILIASGLSAKSRDKPPKESLRSLLINLMNAWIFCLLIIIPQFLVYYKTGLQGRYLMPFMLGLIFILIFILDSIIKSKSINSVIKYIYISLVLFIFLIDIKTSAVKTLEKFSLECKSTQNTINKISNPSVGKLLFVMDPVQNFHEVFSLKTYLNYLKTGNLYSYQFIKREYLHPFYKDTSLYNSYIIVANEELGNSIIDSSRINNDIKSILIFGSLKEKFLAKNKLWFNENDFRKEEFGSYCLYFRN